MLKENYEQQHMKNLTTYIVITLALFFLCSFIGVSVFIVTFPMVGILDFPYFPSKIGLASFFLSVVFSMMKIKTVWGKIILFINLTLMICMIIFMP